jgi:negative regulator of sigma E activity
LRSLQQTWDLLDELPQPTLDDGFTQTTVEMVAVRMHQDVEAGERRRQRRQRFRRAGQSAAVAAGLLVGFWGVRYMQGRADRELLRDLPVIERVDLYDKVDDLAFLESLSNAGMFAETENEESPGEQP